MIYLDPITPPPDTLYRSLGNGLGGFGSGLPGASGMGPGGLGGIGGPGGISPGPWGGPAGPLPGAPGGPVLSAWARDPLVAVSCHAHIIPNKSKQVF